MLLFGVSSFVALESVAANSSDARVAVVLPPWWTADQAFAAATEQGPIINMGGLPFVVILPNNPGSMSSLNGEWLRLHIPTSFSCFSGDSAT